MCASVSRALLAAAAAALVLAPTAGAHVQVTPATSAVDDAVRFEVLVPNEDDKDTVAVALQVPSGVLPFSYEETPGWERTVERAGNGAVAVVRWEGRLAPEGFVRFSFLAATPPEPGTIAWKALQTYEGDEVVRWIGDAESEYPAAFTEVTESGARVNAGGENEPGPDAGPEASARPEAPADAVAEDDGRDSLTLALAIGALALALMALALSLRRRG